MAEGKHGVDDGEKKWSNERGGETLRKMELVAGNDSSSVLTKVIVTHM
jgi:hypothetical protein